jgi:hypothetical protein
MTHGRVVLAVGGVLLAVAVAPRIDVSFEAWLLVAGAMLVLAVVAFVRELRRGDGATGAFKRLLRNLADVIFGG